MMRRAKKCFKYGSIQVTTEQDQSYVLGLFDMDGGQHNTLHYDETSKEDFKYGSIQVTTEQDQSIRVDYLTWTVDQHNTYLKPSLLVSS